MRASVPASASAAAFAQPPDPPAPLAEPRKPLEPLEPLEPRPAFAGRAGPGRPVGPRIFDGRLALPPLPARLTTDWSREATQQLALEPGDVEPLSLPRARTRWPGYRACVQAAADWLAAHGMAAAFADADIALMACRGAPEHHDAQRYGDKAFCNLFLSDDGGQDVLFPAAGRRIPLAPGTVFVFDTAQPHAVVRRGAARFDAADFAEADATLQVFLTWELPLEAAGVQRALGLR